MSLSLEVSSSLEALKCSSSLQPSLAASVKPLPKSGVTGPGMPGTSSSTKSSSNKEENEEEDSKPQVYLRPTNGPLLNAPRNSTQFIIDDHENNQGFMNFDQHQQQLVNQSRYVYVYVTLSHIWQFTPCTHAGDEEKVFSKK